MRIDCVSCGYEINLDHRVFDDYAGPIKCYCCGAMMEVTTAQGLIRSVLPLKIFKEDHGSRGLQASPSPILAAGALP
jgi:hypothetical protein